MISDIDLKGPGNHKGNRFVWIAFYQHVIGEICIEMSNWMSHSRLRILPSYGAGLTERLSMPGGVYFRTFYMYGEFVDR